MTSLNCVAWISLSFSVARSDRSMSALPLVGGRPGVAIIVVRRGLLSILARRGGQDFAEGRRTRNGKPWCLLAACYNACGEAGRLDMGRRVVITGMGVVTPLGDIALELFRSQVEGRSGV